MSKIQKCDQCAEHRRGNSVKLDICYVTGQKCIDRRESARGQIGFQCADYREKVRYNAKQTD